MRRELIESYYEEYQRELERFLESDPEMFTLEAEIHHYTGTGPQRWRTGDVADTGQDYFSEKCNGGNCGKRNVYPGISGL